MEPSEVCIALCAHPAIQSAIILPFRGAARNPSLVAYVVLNSDVQVHAATLRKHLQARLPEYMLPNAFVVLESLPLNANGKVDRSALPAPNTANCLKNASPSTLPPPTGNSLPASSQL